MVPYGPLAGFPAKAVGCPEKARRRRRHWLAVLLAAAVCPVAAVRGGDAAGAGQWIDEDLILTALDYTESVLVNFAAEFTMTTPFSDSVPGAPASEGTFRVSRSEYQYLWEDGSWRSEQYAYRENGSLGMVSCVADDGQYITSLMPTRGPDGERVHPYATGSIFPSRGPKLGDDALDAYTLLNVAGEPLSDTLRRGDAVMEGLEETAGRMCVVFEVLVEGTNRMRVFLDPTRGFALVRKELFYMEHPDWLGIVMEAEGFAEVQPDVWLPTKARVTMFRPDASGAHRDRIDHINEIVVRPGSLRTNQALDEDAFRIAHPVGTFVHDGILGLDYISGLDVVLGELVGRLGETDLDAEFDILLAPLDESMRRDPLCTPSSPGNRRDTPAASGAQRSPPQSVSPAGPANGETRGRRWLTVACLMAVCSASVALRRLLRRGQPAPARGKAAIPQPKGPGAC